ncbi:hypothetical protein PVL29_021039 [Vitis rotundifolia]|uniref:Uncharacterized protein n=1 Tax=Vitis rotundifolia TaxID=103349 RepID=A0AA38YYL6_VITRO|nr:hypothetical protein PVL29_021039 [Vitis rotundifolia]
MGIMEDVEGREMDDEMELKVVDIEGGDMHGYYGGCGGREMNDEMKLKVVDIGVGVAMHGHAKDEFEGHLKKNGYVVWCRERKGGELGYEEVGSRCVV